MDQANHRNQADGGETRTSKHHAIAVLGGEEERKDWLISMEAKINQPPKLLNESAGKDCCSICRVPQSIMEINQKAYQPHVVSIGPYHHGKQHLQMIQEHKWRYLKALLARTNAHGIGLDHLFQAIASKEESIRESYSETIEIQSLHLIEMMVLDGCFILELFRKVYQMEATDDQDDPILKIAWVLPFIARDLLMLENQIPFFVLQTLFNKPISALGGNTISSLNNLALGFFRLSVGRPVDILERYEHVHGKHILDLFRLSLIPPSSKRSKFSEDVNMIPSVEKLRRAGIKFEPRNTESFVDIKFSNGVLQIPTLTLDDFFGSLLLNCVAFEQFHRHCSTEITTYTTFMGCLINTPGDAGFLRDKKILENYIGTDEQVALLFNNIGKDMVTDISNSYLAELFIDVSKYISKGWHVHWAEFINTYFRTRWSFISVIAASMLLILTMIQAFFAIYPYIPHNHN